jgi:hypothetical protein
MRVQFVKQPWPRESSFVSMLAPRGKALRFTTQQGGNFRRVRF